MYKVYFFPRLEIEFFPEWINYIYQFFYIVRLCFFCFNLNGEKVSTRLQKKGWGKNKEYTYSMISEKLNSELFKNFIQRFVCFFFFSVQYKTINTIRKKKSDLREFFDHTVNKNLDFFLNNIILSYYLNCSTFTLKEVRKDFTV